MSTVYKYAIFLALAQAAIAADETQVKMPAEEVLREDAQSSCETERMLGEIDCALNCPDCDCKERWDYSCDDDEPRAGEKIKDALEDIWNRYADNDAIEQWADQTQKDVDEMEQKQQQEYLELVEQVGEQVGEAINGALQQMADDFAVATDEANKAISKAVEEFTANEAESIEKIDEAELRTLKMKQYKDHAALQKRGDSLDEAKMDTTTEAKEMSCEEERDNRIADCVTNCGMDCDCEASYEDWCKSSPGEKIKDTLEEILERYADEEAIEEWAGQVNADFKELESKYQQEQAELTEKIAKQVEEAVNAALEKMAEDVAQKSDEANQALNDGLKDLFAKEDEAIEEISDRARMDVKVLKEQKQAKKNLQPRVAKSAPTTKEFTITQKRAKQIAFAKDLATKIQQNNNPSRDYLVYGTGALTLVCAASLAAFVIVKKQKRGSDLDEDFHRV